MTNIVPNRHGGFELKTVLDRFEPFEKTSQTTQALHHGREMSTVIGGYVKIIQLFVVNDYTRTASYSSTSDMFVDSAEIVNQASSRLLPPGCDPSPLHRCTISPNATPEALLAPRSTCSAAVAIPTQVRVIPRETCVCVQVAAIYAATDWEDVQLSVGPRTRRPSSTHVQKKT